MINLDALRNSSLLSDPFKFSLVENFLSDGLTRDLLKSLPQINNYRSVRDLGSDKTYNVVNNLLVKLGDSAPNPDSFLNSQWTNLVKAFLSYEYVECLSKLLDENLSLAHQEITLKRYGFNDFISPHTDKESVIATHMIFLNPVWDESWGGRLCLMLDEYSSFRKILPIAKNSVAFVRSENSWHSVDPIVNKAAERIAIQVAFWRQVERHVLPGRLEEQLKT